MGHLNVTLKIGAVRLLVQIERSLIPKLPKIKISGCKADFPLSLSLLSSSSFTAALSLLPTKKMATLNLSLVPKTLSPTPHTLIPFLPLSSKSSLSFIPCAPTHPIKSRTAAFPPVRALTDGEYSAKRSGGREERETIMLPGCDYNHWLIVMEFPKDPAPTREQMIDTYLNTLATVLGRFFSSFLIFLGILGHYLLLFFCFLKLLLLNILCGLLGSKIVIILLDMCASNSWGFLGYVSLFLFHYFL